MGIRDLENNEYCKWFLSKLSCEIGEIIDIVIVLDRHQSIIEVVPKVFPMLFMDIAHSTWS